MSVYVIDRLMADKSAPDGVGRQRVVVFGLVSEDGGALAASVYDSAGDRLDTGLWLSGERLALYEEMVKADRNWRSLTKLLGRDDEAPGRVA